MLGRILKTELVEFKMSKSQGRLIETPVRCTSMTSTERLSETSKFFSITSQATLLIIVSTSQRSLLILLYATELSPQSSLPVNHHKKFANVLPTKSLQEELAASVACQDHSESWIRTEMALLTTKK